jgi:predicted ATPase
MRASPVLIGRASELGALSAVVEEARKGRARGVLVHGAPGVGKTRLLHEAANESSERGVRVARSSCLPLTTPLPFDPVLELLRSLGEPLPAAVTESPRELFGIVVDRLERATIDGPLLCLDDLQWSDVGTVDLVHYCLARLVDLPIAWLMAARPASTLGRVAHRLARAGVLEQLELEALSAAEVRRLAEAILGDDRVSDRLAELLYARGGNPFLCEELLRLLRDVAAPGVSRDDGVGEIDRLVPASVSDAIEERVSRLPATAQEALGWAAVLPEPFTFEELEAVGGEDLGDAPESLAGASFLNQTRACRGKPRAGALQCPFWSTGVPRDVVQR